MKRTLLTMAAALALVGCSKSELVDTPVQEQNAIAFDTYVGRDAQTRATIVDLDVVKLKGFGVNAYYNAEFTTDDDGQITGFTYDDTFMHNTKVTYNDEKGVWTYSPIKYWPNNVDDHLTFFAYAPYDKSNPGLGEGNVDMSKIYDFTIAENVKDQIDLVYHKAFGEDGDMATADNGQTYQMKKQKIMDKVRFNFQHALSRISFDVKAVVDDINDESDNLLDGNTHINIKEVALVKVSDAATDDPFYKTATLDMTTGQWIYDEEAGYQEYHMTGEDFYRPVEVKTKYTDAWGDPWYESEYVAQLSKFNPAQRLLADDHYLMILPQEFAEGSGYRIYIEYDVISEEVNNNGIGENTTEDSSTITNKIYSEVLDGAFEQGKAYKFTLWLGMTSVKIDATETAWTEEDNMNIWMPENCAFDVDAQGNLLIKTAEDLAMFRTLINNGSWYVTDEGEELQYAYASYLQTKDIDLSSVLGGEDNDYWNPIGVDGADGPDNPTIFCGTYDGGGHTVSNVNIHNKYDNSAYMSGLFYKTRDVTIKNLNVEGSMIDCWGHWVGGVVGWADGESTIENCHFSGSIVLAENSKGSQATGFLGGVVGEIYSGKVIACSNNAEIYAPFGSSIPIGGVVGNAGSAEIIGCYNTGMIDVDSNNNTIGGIVGKTSAAVTSCYNKGNIFIDDEATGNSVGSIIGSSGTPSYCYYTSDFSAVSGADDSSYTSVKNVSFSDVADDGKSTIAPWLNYGLNGDANNLSGYEYYVDYYDLKIQAGNDTGKEPPVKVMQWVDSGLKHVDDVIQITSARDLAIARDLVNNGTKSFFESDSSVSKYVQVEVEAEYKDTAEGDKEGSGYFYSGSYKQTADINFLDLIDDKDYSADASNWTPIGFVSRYFTGKFDGNTFEIKNLEITDIGDDNNYAGLFGFVENATLSNINIVSCNINLKVYAAAIAGRALENTTITNCTVGTESNNQATIYGGFGAAGIICDPNNTKFVDCTNYASITSSSSAGGITNDAGESTFENCSNYGEVTAGKNSSNSPAAAGICAVGGKKFVNCHNYQTISGGRVGGIVTYAKADAVIYGSHNEGAINSSYAGAGICCSPNGSVTLRSCYNTASISGNLFSAGLIAYPLVGDENKQQTYTMIACYNTGSCDAAFVHYSYEGDETYTTLVFDNCYYTNANDATTNWETEVTGATKFDDTTHLWFREEADAGEKTIVMNAMNDVLAETDDVKYESNGDDATATATHPLIHKAN